MDIVCVTSPMGFWRIFVNLDVVGSGHCHVGNPDCTNYWSTTLWASRKLFRNSWVTSQIQHPFFILSMVLPHPPPYPVNLIAHSQYKINQVTHKCHQKSNLYSKRNVLLWRMASTFYFDVEVWQTQIYGQILWESKVLTNISILSAGLHLLWLLWHSTRWKNDCRNVRENLLFIL